MAAELESIRNYLSRVYEEAMLKQMERMSTLEALMSRERAPSRKYHKRPPTAEEEAAFEDWKRRFTAAMGEGYKNNWLTWDYDEDPKPVDEHPQVVVYDETKEEHQARLEAWREAKAAVLSKNVTFPIVSRPAIPPPSEEDLNSEK